MCYTETPLTIVIAAYNCESTIGRTIDSIIKQSFTEWSCIIVNDNSADNTKDVIEHYANIDKRIQVINQDSNMGAAYSRNHAISLSRSPLIAIVDADDICLPERFRIQVDFLNSHPDIDVLGSAAFYVFKDSPTRRSLVRLPEFHESLVVDIKKRVPFIHPSVIYRRAFIERAGGYRVELRRSEDADLWLRTYKWARFHNIHVPLIVYSCRENTSLKDAYYMMRRHFEYSKSEGIVMSHAWYIIRPIVSYFATRIGLKADYFQNIKNKRV